MSELSAVPPRWVTLRTTTDEGMPVVVLVDEAVATTCPYDEETVQVAVAVQLGPTDDGLPAEDEAVALKGMEQRLVDTAAPDARLVAVMTLEGVREWTFYGTGAEWAAPLKDLGVSVLVAEDPTWSGLRQLAGLA
jgi:hypothetical protein